MQRSINKVFLIGNSGKDPDVTFTSGGTKVAIFRMATSDSRRDKQGELQVYTDWHTVVAFRGLADVVEKFVRKGTRLFVEGSLSTRHYEDKNGIQRSVTEVVTVNLVLLDYRYRDAQGSGDDAQVAQNADADGVVIDPAMDESMMENASLNLDDDKVVSASANGVHK